MISNNVFAHPNEDGVLLISASIENIAERKQYYPALEVSLTDADSNLVALRRFKPSEYLEGYNKKMVLDIKKPIGSYHLKSNLLLSPMAGITDRPYRDICRDFGAGLTTSEMITSDASLIHTRKTQLRMLGSDEPEPRTVQILGTDPDVMAEAARFNVERGAQILDINMGCPAKKGQPWVFQEINDLLNGESTPTTITFEQKKNTALKHIDAIHRFYGTDQGVRIARKHIGWYLYNLIGHKQPLLQKFKKEVFTIPSASDQFEVFEHLLNEIEVST
ncbi:tRNA-dihydrouridine synthase B [Nymphon striatum]|nr:tRNA-dihydrouridine synthase B [Nymphon striatum]